MEQTRLLGLIEKSKAGDRQAQEELVVATQDKVYYHCKKMLKNEQDALDATQDVLITMLTSLDKLKAPAAFFGWVNGITANRCKHLLTQGITEWQIPEDEEGHSLLDTLETLDEASAPHKVLDNVETQRLMLGIIDDLPPVQRMTVLFYYYDEMSVGEIAEAMDVSRGTVMSRLNYARKSIKTGVEKLEKQGTKLYGLSPLPLLLFFLRWEAAQGGLTAAQSAPFTATALSGGAGAAGAGVATETATTAGTATAVTIGTTAAKAGSGLGAKIAIGMVATALVGGAAVGGMTVVRQMKETIPVWAEWEETQPAEEQRGADLGVEAQIIEAPLPESVIYYGDNPCHMTPEQAMAYAEIIRDEMARFERECKQYEGPYDFSSYTPQSFATLFDLGGGEPALFFAGGGEPQASDYYAFNSIPSNATAWEEVWTVGIWSYRDGERRELPLNSWALPVLYCGSHIYADETNGGYKGAVYSLGNGVLPLVPANTAEASYLEDAFLDTEWFEIDGQPVDRATFEQWREGYTSSSLMGLYQADLGAGYIQGMADAKTVADALDAYARSVLVDKSDNETIARNGG